VITSLLDAIDEEVDEQKFDRIAAAQQLQTEDYKPEFNKVDTFRDILPSLLTRKRYILERDKDYVPYLVNRMISYHDDTLYLANEMNMLWQLPHSLQYDFYFHGIRARKRDYAKWIKPVKAEDLDAVKLYFGYSNQKAHQALNTLTEDQIQTIRDRTQTGE